MWVYYDNDDDDDDTFIIFALKSRYPSVQESSFSDQAYDSRLGALTFEL